ncbi:diacylglycerol/lipid kinase family protein [Salinithrix halophila]|uniref:Diacylglycerol/lipid kinase family protein n=1 Tax=Salinithrix halophila TaxID=1485204 RepID=A0ABV8JML7_9BACL
MYTFLVNPAAGNGRGQQVWNRVRKKLEKTSIPYQAEITSYAGEATEIARKLAEQPGIRAIVAIGGDGTVHEVGNGLVKTEIPLGYIPAGSGNDFASAHGIPSHPERALERILRHQVRRIDTAQVNNRMMIGFSGIGFDGKVAESVNSSSSKRWLGRFAYLAGAFQTWARFRPYQMTLVVDGQPFHYQGIWLIAVANIPNYGGGMLICPHADSGDGLLDLCCVHSLTKARFLQIIPSVFRGAHIHHPSVSLHRGETFTITSDPPLPIHADGEIIGKTPATIRIHPQSLSIL